MKRGRSARVNSSVFIPSTFRTISRRGNIIVACYRGQSTPVSNGRVDGLVEHIFTPVRHAREENRKQDLYSAAPSDRASTLGSPFESEYWPGFVEIITSVLVFCRNHFFIWNVLNVYGLQRVNTSAKHFAMTLKKKTFVRTRLEQTRNSSDWFVETLNSRVFLNFYPYSTALIFSRVVTAACTRQNSEHGRDVEHRCRRVPGVRRIGIFLSKILTLWYFHVRVVVRFKCFFERYVKKSRRRRVISDNMLLVNG